MGATPVRTRNPYSRTYIAGPSFAGAPSTRRAHANGVDPDQFRTTCVSGANNVNAGR
jgi:hypothetical protein